jgi:hypothetical protein
MALSLTNYVTLANTNNVGAAIDGNYMYVCSAVSNNIARVNLIDQTISNTWATSTQGINATYGITVLNGFLYGTTRTNTSDKVFQISITNPSTYSTVKTIDLTSYYPNVTYATSGYIYVAAVNVGADKSTICRISITNPAGDYISSCSYYPKSNNYL